MNVYKYLWLQGFCKVRLVHKIKINVFSLILLFALQHVYCPGTYNDMQHLIYSQDGALRALTYLLTG